MKAGNKKNSRSAKHRPRHGPSFERGLSHTRSGGELCCCRRLLHDERAEQVDAGLGGLGVGCLLLLEGGALGLLLDGRRARPPASAWPVAPGAPLDTPTMPEG